MCNVITISGLLATGKSTLAMELSKYLNLNYTCMGGIYRRNNKIIEVGNNSKIEEIDSQLDTLIEEEIIKGDVVIEGRTAGYIGSKVKHEETSKMINILLICEPLIRLKRLIERDNGLERTLDRDYIDVQRFLKRYGININDPHLYDIIINTSNLSKKDVFLAAKEQIENNGRKN